MYVRAWQTGSILPRMLFLLVGLSVGVVGTLVLLAPAIAHNRRRIKDLERGLGRVARRQKAHGVVIRHLAEESIEPDEPEPPPHRHRDSRLFRGAAGIGVVAVLARRHPVGAGLAAAGTATVAAVLAVTLTPMQAQGGPDAAGLQAPSSVAASYAAPVVVPTVPSPPRSPSASQAAPTSAMPAPATSGSATEAPRPTPSQPLLVVSLPPVSASVALPLPSLSVPVLPTGSLLPSTPVSVPPPSVPHPSHSGTPCVVNLNLPPPLRVCLL